MHAMWLAAVAAATVGVDVGWQPAEDGGMEYIIQLAPHQARSLKSGDVIEVGVRPEMRDVRRYRIVVGDTTLPRRNNSLGNSAKNTVTVMNPVMRDGPGRSVVVQPRLAPTTEIPTTAIPTTAIPTSAIPAASILRTQSSATSTPSARLAEAQVAEAPRLRFPPTDDPIARPTLSIADPDSISARDAALSAPDRTAGWNIAPAERAAYDAATAAGISENENGVKPRFELPAKTNQRYQPGDSVPLKPLDDLRGRFPDTTIAEAAENAAGALIGAPSNTPPSPPENAFGGERIPNRYPDDPSTGSRYEWPKAPANQPAAAPLAPLDRAATAVADDRNPSFPGENRQPAVAVDPPPRYAQPAAMPAQPRRPEVAPRVVSAVDQPGAGYSHPPAQPKTTFVAAASGAGSPAEQGYQANKLNPQQPVPTANPPVPQGNAALNTAAKPVEPVERPWFPLTLTLFALFASLGGNLFLGWVTWDIRLRFRELLIRARRDSDGTRDSARGDDLDDQYDSRRDM